MEDINSLKMVLASNDPDPLMTLAETAEFLGVTVGDLRGEFAPNDPPSHGGRYRKSEVRAWMKSRTIYPAVMHRILQMVRDTGTNGISPADLVREFGSGEYCVDKGHNVVIFAGITAPVAAALQELGRTKAIRYEPTSLLVHLVTGSPIPSIPMGSNRMPANGYTKPHWAPALLYSCSTD